VSAVLVDTHVAVWWLLAPERLSAAASRALEAATKAGDPITIASISLVEIRYLTEKGRLSAAVLDRILQEAEDHLGAFRLAPLDLAVVRAMAHISRDEVPDLPDRVIAATASALGVPS
jgi:PIN domain nuclease of toxin-antitoxin system